MLEIKQLPKSEIEISGEMPAEEFAKFWQKAISELSKKLSIPGFRPGKVPEKILIEKMGDAAVLDKAAELALQNFYPRVVQEKKLEVIGFPRATITKIAKNAPFGYKFVTAILPEIKLPEDYKKTAGKIAKTEEKITVDEKEVDEAVEYLKKKGKEINDELKNIIGKNIRTEKEFKNREKKRLEMLDAILKDINLEIPDILIEGEKNKMLYELKSSLLNMGLKWEDYLGHIKKKEEDILAGWNDESLRRVKYGLLLRRLAGEVKVEVSEKEIIDSGYPKDYAYGIIRNDKVFQFLETC